jgi:AAA+ ATPase superfamily predicted ATPase
VVRYLVLYYQVVEQVVPKPETLFDRDFEWSALASFATGGGPGAALGIVSGRRRQGKTLLLQELCAATGGFYFAATEATAPESLRLLARALADHSGQRVPLALSSWEDALDALLDLGADAPAGVPVVVDEFPYLCRPSPELPSVIQKALAPRAARRVASRCRLILCGSAVTFMGRLLSGSAPLRGRAGLELTVPPFDPRTAAAFWGITDWALALRVHAVVGGTPAYRREYVNDDAPASLADFGPWVCRTVLNPASPLHREARYLLAEESDIRDPALYHSVLAAIASGNRTRGAIATYVGRPADTVGHPITVLEDAGLVVREPDALRQARSYYRISDPLITFYHGIMRPEWSRLQRPGSAEQVWADSQDRFASTVLGPHFESLCRWWTATHATAAALGARVVRVASGVVNDPSTRTSHEVDVIGLDVDGRIVCLGEAKLGATVGAGHLERLRRVRELIARTDERVRDARLLLFSGAGFAADLLPSAPRQGVELVDLERLYTGS